MNLLAFYSLLPYNIESPQPLYFMWSKDINLEDGESIPPEDDSRFEWEYSYQPHLYDNETDQWNAYHVWFKYKIGDKGSWKGPAKINSPSIVKGDKGDKGDIGLSVKGDKGAIGTGLNIKYADSSFNEVSGTSPSVYYINIRRDGEPWIGWKKLVGSDGVSTGGTGLPAGGIEGQILRNTGASTEWIDLMTLIDAEFTATSPITYTHGVITHLDTEGNRHIPSGGTEGEILQKVSGIDTWVGVSSLFSDFSASSPIVFNDSTGVISHASTVGNRHIPAGDSSDEVLKADGAGNYSWSSIIELLDNSGRLPIIVNTAEGEIQHSNDPGYKHVPDSVSSNAILTPNGDNSFGWNLVLDDGASTGDTTSLYSADKITALIEETTAYTLRYKVDTEGALPEGNLNELALVEYDRSIYKKGATAWSLWFYLNDLTYLDTYYTRTNEIGAAMDEKFTRSADLTDTSGSNDLVDWSVISNIPNEASRSSSTNFGMTVTTTHQNQVNASDWIAAGSEKGQVNISTTCITADGADYCQINASANVSTETPYSSVWGYATDGISVNHQTVRIESIEGHAFFKGNVRIGVDSVTSPSFSDYNLEVEGDVNIDGNIEVESILVKDATGITAEAATAGTMRYTSTATSSSLEVVMQTGSSTYEWIVIETNTWAPS